MTIAIAAWGTLATAPARAQRANGPSAATADPVQPNSSGAKTPEKAAPEAVGILQVDVAGVSDTTADLLEASLEDGLGTAGFRVARRARLRELLGTTKYFEGCLFGPCLKTVYAATGVRLLLVARIEGVGKNFSFIVTLLDARTGAPLSQIIDHCPICTVDEAIATASLSVIGLVRGSRETEVADPSTGPTGLALANAAQQEREERWAAETTARRKKLARGSLFLVTAAVAAGALSVYGFVSDNNDLAIPAAAAAGAFSVSSGLVFLISRTF